MDSKVQPISAKEAEIMMDGPALFCNRVLVSVGPTVRITFVEQEQGTAKNPKFRSAVAMPHQDAIALYHVLAELLKPFEDQLATVTPQPEGSHAPDAH